MKITQHDIAKLSDREVKAWAVHLHNLSETGVSFAPVAKKFAFALVRAMRERNEMRLTLECELLNPDDEIGELVDETPD